MSGASSVRVELGAHPRHRPSSTWRTAPRPLSVLAKPSGAICNLDCDYCFFLAKEQLYPDGRFRMAEEVLEAYLTQLLELHPGPEITISWQGGEPTLLGVDFYRRAIGIAKALVRPGVRLQHTIQTNATLLDDRWAALFAEEQFLVGVSIDGPRDLHDRYRHDKAGRPTYDRVRAGLELLVAHEVDVNALVTVNAANEAHPLEVYRHLRDDLGLEYLQLIPIVERVNATGFQEGTEVTERSVSPSGWGRFLTTIFDEWRRHDVGSVFVSMFDAALAPKLGLPATMCIFAETCGDALALEHNGDLYSCDHFVEPGYLLGNITEQHLGDLAASPAQQRFGAAKAEGLVAQCRRCPALASCRGECPKNRFTTTADGEFGLNYLCEGYLTFFTHAEPVLELMATQLRRGGFADEVMDLLNEADPAAPCPCGSGVPAGRCHR